MNRVDAAVQAPAGITTLDLLLFTAGFACGWVMHQGSALRSGRVYILPVILHLAFLLPRSRLPVAAGHGMGRLALGVCDRPGVSDCRSALSLSTAAVAPPEWLAVALAIVLFESVYPAFRTESPGAMTGETVWIEPSAADPTSDYAVQNYLQSGILASKSTAAVSTFGGRRQARSGRNLVGRPSADRGGGDDRDRRVVPSREAEPGLGGSPPDRDRGLSHLDRSGWPRRRRPKFRRPHRILRINRAPARNPGAGRGSPLITTHAPGRVTRSGRWHW